MIADDATMVATRDGARAPMKGVPTADEEGVEMPESLDDE
jgi:hypothetical protein